MKDRQPQVGTTVLLANKYFCDYDGILPGKWFQTVYQAGVNADVIREDSNVTHWMPLPAPPKL